MKKITLSLALVFALVGCVGCDRPTKEVPYEIGGGTDVDDDDAVDDDNNNDADNNGNELDGVAPDDNGGYEPVSSGEVAYLTDDNEIVVSRQAFPNAENMIKISVIGEVYGNPDESECSNTWIVGLCDLISPYLLPNGDMVVNQDNLPEGYVARFAIGGEDEHWNVLYMKVANLKDTRHLIEYNKAGANIMVGMSGGKLIACGSYSRNDDCRGLRRL